MFTNFYLLCLFNFLSFTFEGYCGSYIPKDEGTCDQYTNSTDICCFLSSYNTNGNYYSRCYPFSRETYYTLGRTVAINGYVYKLDCGKKRGALCGKIVNPVTYKDCGIYSTKKNSCCFYKYLTNSNCVWLGTSDIGNYTYKNMTLVCMSSFLNFNLLSVLILFIILF